MSVQMNAHLLSTLDEQGWQDLQIYEDLQRWILIDLAKEALSETELKQHVLTRVQGTAAILFDLVFSDFLQLLIKQDLIVSTEDQLTLSDGFKEKVVSQISEIDSDERQSTLPSENSVTKETQITSTDSLDEHFVSKKNYVDPLTYISSGHKETLFTIRRLDRLLNALDGLTIQQNRLQEILNLPPSSLSRLLKQTNQMEMTRIDGQFIKLHWHGHKLVRLARQERLKTLGRIAARMRKEDSD